MTTSFEDRIAKLETSNRRLRLLLLGVAIVSAAGIGLGMTQASKVPDVIQAKSFEVVNDDGVAVVKLKSWQRGGWIETNNHQGERLFLVAASEFGGVAAIFDGAGSQLVTLNTSETGTGTISTFDRAGTGMVSLGTNTSGEGLIRTFNSSGGKLVTISSSPSGGGVSTYNQKGGRVTALEACEHGGKIMTRNTKGKTVFLADADNDGHGFMQVVNSQGSLLARVGALPNRAAGSVEVFNETGGLTVGINSGTTGDGMVNTYSGRGTKLASLTATKDGDGGVLAFDRDGNLRSTLSGGAPPAVIQARRFEVVNDAGTPMVTLTSSGAGGWIDTSNAEGEFLFLATANHHGQGQVVTFDGKGTGLVKFTGTEFGTGAIQTCGSTGNVLAEIGAAAAGGRLTLFDGGELPQVRLLAAEQGGWVSTSDGNGSPLVTIGRSKAGHGVLSTFNASGGTLVKLAATATGDGGVLVYDHDGVFRELDADE